MTILRLTFVAILLLVSTAASAQTVDEIVARHVEARGGGEKLRAIHSLRFTGRAESADGRDAIVVHEIKRPGRVRTEFTLQGMTGVYAYDGEDGWRVAPFRGIFEPEPMPEENEKLAEERADVDGVLVDWKAKGHKVELAGRESVGGREAFKLEVTLENGAVYYVYVDAESYLRVRTDTTQELAGHTVTIETTYGDHKAVDGVIFPHTIETGARDRPGHLRMIVEQVEINPSIDDARFEMPSNER